jgi:methylated-DNA-[protein]-cysteine S-methyltransferase
MSPAAKRDWTMKRTQAMKTFATDVPGAGRLVRRRFSLPGFGAVAVIANDAALVGVVFGDEPPSRKWTEAVEVRGKHEVLDQVGAALAAWAVGAPEADAMLRALPCDLSGQTPFTKAVLTATRAIPRGQPGSYGSVARAIGVPQAARAVGGALGRNPVPIVIPCHRVLAGGGGIGGFTGGLAIKRALLKIEKTEVVGE